MEQEYIKQLYNLSKIAYKKNEIPISALLIKDEKIIAKAYNKKNIEQNPLLHAEIICLQKAYKKLKRWNLNDCELYVSLEPCDMCKEIIAESRIKNVYFILNRGNINNKYTKTQYKQTFTELNFIKLMNDAFKNIRNVKQIEK